LPVGDELPDDLKPRHPFNERNIRAGLPEAKASARTDCRWLSFKSSKR
jgi:hypothetical protein